MISIRPFQPADADWLAPRLRETDLRTLAALSDESPMEALWRCARDSDPCYSMVTSEVIAIFGAVPDEPDSAVVWLVGSDGIADNAAAFALESPTVFALLHARYRFLWNYTDARNPAHLRWLSRCGFTIDETIHYVGVDRVPFRYFYRDRDAVPG